MIPITGKIFTSYLLLPVIAFLMGIVVLLVAKKNKLLSDKKAVFYLLLSSLLFGLPGLMGSLGVNYMPYGYGGLQVLYLFLGYLNSVLLTQMVEPLKDKSFGWTFLFLLFQTGVGIAVFSVLFNLTNDFRYGLWAGTCLLPLIIVPLFTETFRSYLAIPAEIYKMRIYDGSGQAAMPMRAAPIDTDELLVFEIEIYKSPTDVKPIHLKAKATRDMVFGDWYELIISDYNQKKFASPIEYFNTQDPYGWIFYAKPSFFLPRKYIDPDLSFTQNKLSEKHLIVSKRVRKDYK